MIIPESWVQGRNITGKVLFSSPPIQVCTINMIYTANVALNHMTEMFVSCFVVKFLSLLSTMHFLKKKKKSHYTWPILKE